MLWPMSETMENPQKPLSFHAYAPETALRSDADSGGENHRGRSTGVQKHDAEVQAVQKADEHARERWTR